MQRTLIIFKPDCVQRRLTGSILARFEAKGLRIGALKMLRVDRTLAEKHYAEHKGKPFFGGLIDFITSAPVVVGVVVHWAMIADPVASMAVCFNRSALRSMRPW